MYFLRPREFYTGFDGTDLLMEYYKHPEKNSMSFLMNSAIHYNRVQNYPVAPGMVKFALGSVKRLVKKMNQE